MTGRPVRVASPLPLTALREPELRNDVRLESEPVKGEAARRSGASRRTEALEPAQRIRSSRLVGAARSVMRHPGAWRRAPTVERASPSPAASAGASVGETMSKLERSARARVNPARFVWAMVLLLAWGAYTPVRAQESEAEHPEKPPEEIDASPATPTPDAAAERARGAAEIFDAVTVVAARVEQRLGEVAGTVSVIEREQLDRRQVQSLADLVRYEPAISATGEAGRFGTSGLRIRGMEGNRVAIVLDGTPLPDGFAVGSFANAGRDLVDLELLRSVEILRGPASALHGSDALGGVVVLTTRDPGDYLSGPGQWRAKGRAGFDERDGSVRTSVLAALGGEAWRGLALGSLERGHELDNRGDPRPDPAAARDGSGFLRLTGPAGAGRIGLTADHRQGRVETEVRHLVGGPGQFATTERLLADDRRERTRIALSHLIGPVGDWLEEGSSRLHWSEHEADQRTRQWRAADARTPAPTRRDRSFDYREALAGLEWTGRSRLGSAATAARLIWGFELEEARLEELRDGRETNLSTGAQTRVVLGEALPVRDFPRSRTRALGLYVAAELRTPAGRWRLEPALRYDRYATRAEPDALYREDFPDTEVVDTDDQALTPKLGLVRALGRGHLVYLHYAEGFRAPPVYDVNVGLRIPIFDYVAIPNPDLRPERSRGFELGWRYASARASAQLALYDNRYRDLIESRVNLGVDPATGATVFQSLNRDRARIRGGEARLRLDLGRFDPGARGWQVDAALAWAEGEDTRRRQPLSSVDPDRATLGLSWESDGGGWWASAVATFAASRRGEVDRSVVDAFAAPGYEVLDLLARCRPGGGRWTVELALLNALDARYWSAARARGLVASDPLLGFHTEPGRALLVTFSLEVGTAQ